MLFVCEHCEENPHQFEINSESLDWENVETSEAAMGARNTYVAEWEDVCPKCDNSVSATFTTWEYPEGSVEHSEAMYDGITPLNPNEKIQYDVSFKDDTDD